MYARSTGSAAQCVLDAKYKRQIATVIKAFEIWILLIMCLICHCIMYSDTLTTNLVLFCIFKNWSDFQACVPAYILSDHRFAQARLSALFLMSQGFTNPNRCHLTPSHHSAVSQEAFHSEGESPSWPSADTLFQSTVWRPHRLIE